jgi:hypothetical protein
MVNDCLSKSSSGTDETTAELNLEEDEDNQIHNMQDAETGCKTTRRFRSRAYDV